MKVQVSENYSALSIQAADYLSGVMKGRSQPLLCLASGDSPTGLYKELIRRQSAGETDLHQWTFISLDEWVGLDGTEEGSCRYMLDKQFFFPAGIADEKLYCFNGKAPDLVAEAEQMEEFIRHHGGIQAAILGLGMNGHVGLNEPGTDPAWRIHSMDLSATTVEVGQKYFSKPRILKRGITLGIANLMEARNLLMIVSGTRKAPIVKKMLEEPVDRNLPVSLLKNHPSFSVFLDKDAASMLSKQK